MTEANINVREILLFLRGRQNEMVRLLEKFVRCESPSLDKEAVDRMGKIVAAEWQTRGAQVRVLQQPKRGNQVRAEIGAGTGRSAGGPSVAGQLLVLGHMDTVYPFGMLASMPFRLSGGRAWGPGTFDMKSGIVLALFAVDALRALKIAPRKRLVFFWCSDEEIGSESSRKLFEAEARRSDAVFVAEPALGSDGRLKTARKGVGSAEVIVTGRSAHAGIEPERGVNAVHELALQIERLMKMNDPRRGITVQATVVGGGTVSNVVPDHARAEVDIRFARLSDSKQLDRKIRSLRPILPGAKIEVRGGINRPPLERTKEGAKLFAHAQSLMREIGITVDEASTGGGSDGNFTSALGIPTLDGLGPVGDGAHSPREHVVIRRLPERAALLAGLLATV
ncbi:MAG: M20 family metallopeptidase [Candidatus Acidiferrales bacterium]